MNDQSLIAVKESGAMLFKWHFKPSNNQTRTDVPDFASVESYVATGVMIQRDDGQCAEIYVAKEEFELFDKLHDFICKTNEVVKSTEAYIIDRYGPPYLRFESARTVNFMLDYLLDCLERGSTERMVEEAKSLRFGSVDQLP